MKNSFTLIEALIAVMIVGLSSLGIYSALMTAKKVSYGSRIRLEAQRFSYDLGLKMLKLPDNELQPFIDKMNNVNGHLIGGGNNSEYTPIKAASTTTFDVTSFNVYLGQVDGKLTIATDNQATNSDGDTIKEGELYAKRIDTIVEWTTPTGATLNYSTTIYRYFIK
ncbi:MAG: prepilin-type N-terminal cleavage/methylation domain-containing protein [Lentisphaeria bacterium]|nr:prepilin-type N-terminal cleavage/methylation domain-containing protein [Lentisphaeria bacterium]